MKAEHTPGPWRVEAHGYDSPYMCKAFIETEVGDPVCGLWSGDGPDARLIAAAPQLLDALESLVEQIEQGDFVNRDRRGARNLDAMRVARTVIERARAGRGEGRGR